MPAMSTASLGRAVARIHTLSGRIVGAGFLVADRRVATSASVVQRAFGDASGRPAECLVDFPLLGDVRIKARVESWGPGHGGGPQAVIVELATAVEQTGPPPMFRADDLDGHRFRSLGFPQGMHDGVWAAGAIRMSPSGPVVAADAHGQQLFDGYDGAPVWDEQVGAVVGIIAIDDADARLISVADVLGVDPRLLPNPYRGLEPFDEQHTDYLFGRDDEIGRITAAVAERPLVGVVGRSGVGKSSVMRAGVLPRLRAEGARVAVLRMMGAQSPTAAVAHALSSLLPDDDPLKPPERMQAVLDAGPAVLRAVATKIAEQGGDSGVVLFADQFEELPPPQAASVLRLLLGLTRAAGEMARSLRVVLTLRWESLAHVLTDDNRAEVERGLVPIGHMTREQLRDAIVLPARRAPGLYFEDGLVDRILDDAAAEPGQLPLVESLLAQLWQQRQGGMLTHAAYQQVGGVHGAVAEQAEAAIRTIPPAEMTAVRTLLTRLTTPTDGGGFVRTPVPYGQLPSNERRIADHLVVHRLLVHDRAQDGTHVIEFAHQALIDHWPRLRDWLAADREFLHWLHETERHAAEWDQASRDRGMLLRGRALAYAQHWVHARGESVPPSVHAYVAAASARSRRDRRVRRSVLASLAVVVVATILFGILASYQSAVSEERRASAAAHSMSALSETTARSDPAWAIMLALAAYRSEAGEHTESALVQHYLAYRHVATVLSGASGVIENADASADGRVIAARSVGGLITAWVRRPGKAPRVWHILGAQALAVDVADDGSGVLLVEAKATSFYDVEKRRKKWSIPVGFDDRVVSGLVHGTDVVLSFGAIGFAGMPTADTVQWWRAEDGEPVRIGERKSPDGLTALGFTSAGKVALADGERRTRSLVLWDGDTDGVRKIGRQLIVKQTSLDGSTVVHGTISQDHAVACRYDGITNSATLAPISLRDGSVGEARKVVTVPGDCPLGFDAHYGDSVAVVLGVVVDFRSGTSVPLPVRAGRDSDLRLFGPLIRDRDRYYMLRHDSRRVLIEPLPADADSVGSEVLGSVTGPATAAMTPDGKYLITAGSAGQAEDARRWTVLVTRTEDNRNVGTAEAYAEFVSVDQDGTLVAVGDKDEVAVHQLPDLKRLATVPRDGQDVATYDDPPQFVGEYLLTTAGARADWWNPRTGEKVASLDLTKHGIEPDVAGEVRILPYPKGDRVAVVQPDSDEVVIVDRGGRTVGSLRVGSQPTWVAFDQSGRYAAVVTAGAGLAVWDLREAKQVLGPLPVVNIRKSPANRPPVVTFLDEPGRIALAESGRVSYYRFGSSRPERVLDLRGRTRQRTDTISVSRDGRVLAVDLGSTAVAVPVDVSEWVRTLCRVIDHREFTSEERAMLPEGVATAPLC